MKAMTEEQRIFNRYKKYGATLEFIQWAIQSGIKAGLTRKAALIGVRMALGEQCGVQEYFTPEDIAEALGTTVEEVNRLIEENKDELIKNGGIAKVTFADFKQ